MIRPKEEILKDMKLIVFLCCLNFTIYRIPPLIIVYIMIFSLFCWSVCKIVLDNINLNLKKIREEHHFEFK